MIRKYMFNFDRGSFIVYAILCLSNLSQLVSAQDGILFPQDSEFRERRTLDGIWNFRIAQRNNPDIGFVNEWYSNPLSETGEVTLMPVPSSYNDITQNKTIRDHIGWVWYDREFWIPKSWATQNRIFIRFGGVNYHATVWINGVKVVEHSGGHLPFVAELDATNLAFKSPNRITVAVNNTLSQDTVPQGTIVHQNGDRYPKGYFTLNYNFDFFNYAGIHRPVYLFTTPRNYIDDISVTTDIVGETEGVISFSVTAVPDGLKSNGINNKKNGGQTPRGSIKTHTIVHLEDKKGHSVAVASGSRGQLIVSDANLWWPYTMVKNDSEAGYLYTLVVTLVDEKDNELDIYRLKVGIRSVKWNATSFLINNKPFYFRGFGRHEDFNIRGKGIDNVLLVKDHNLVKWTGANSYRTSHYPYSEEIMDLTDELGIVIIDECPAVSLDGFGDPLLANHKQQIREMVNRDKNRASVVMWSVGNEPQSQKPAAENYFRDIVALNRELDPTRPITLVVAQNYDRDVTAKFVDIISINRYFSWYSDTGHTEVIKESMILDVQNWIKTFHKPVIVAEYGADTVVGLHMSPEFVFTEEYQLEMMKEHFKAFDFLRKDNALIGEMIWNFADFMTAQGITRITGNRKGIFTRDRQPKSSAHYLRARYHLLAAESDGYPEPEDIRDFYPIFSGHQRH